MRIHNFRKNFATNSSSSHSILFFPEGEIPADKDTDEFQWNSFTLSSPEQKQRYLTALLTHHLQPMLGDATHKILNTPEDFPTIDHQSQLSIPTDWRGLGYDVLFWEEFTQYVMQKNVVILGGNDNSGEHPLFPVGAPALPREYPKESVGWVARKDHNYGFWTLFNRRSGKKLRMNFDPSAPTPTNASAPELVDLKITDWCPFKCPACYQNSTRLGSHAKIVDIDAITRQLAAMQVFEVAIGGGEPTMHPEFIRILEGFKARGITPNFTTKNLSFFDDAATVNRVADLCGGFAFSVDNAKHVERVVKALLPHRDLLKDKLAFQYILGLEDSAQDLQDVLLAVAAAKSEGLYPKLTLLGFKSVGRGKFFNHKPVGKWLEVVAPFIKGHWLDVAIDTVLVDRHYNELVEAGVPPQFLTRKDGTFSLYVDAVAGTVAPSSYEDPPGAVPISMKKPFPSKSDLEPYVRMITNGTYTDTGADLDYF